MDDKDAYLPTAEEIAEGCRRIQATWTEAERKKRLVYQPAPLTVQIIDTSDLGTAELED
jgi:hypothetical protein